MPLVASATPLSPLNSCPGIYTVTMVREDGGLLKVKPLSSSETGMVAVSRDETTNFDDNQEVLRIQHST